MSLQCAKSYSSGWKIPEMIHEVFIYLQNSSQIPQKSKNEVGNMAESARGGANHDHLIIQLIFWG